MQTCQYLPTEKALDRIVKKAHDPRHIIIPDLVSVKLPAHRAGLLFH